MEGGGKISKVRGKNKFIIWTCFVGDASRDVK
jgi:hypothetical protein